MKLPPVKVDGQLVTLRWTPPPGASETSRGLTSGLVDRGNADRLWRNWAYWTLRGATDFTWTKTGCQLHSVSMTEDEAVSYLRRPGPDGSPRGSKELKDLARRGVFGTELVS